jgi:hypothetical protein
MAYDIFCPSTRGQAIFLPVPTVESLGRRK